MVLYIKRELETQDGIEYAFFAAIAYGDKWD